MINVDNEKKCEYCKHYKKKHFDFDHVQKKQLFYVKFLFIFKRGTLKNVEQQFISRENNF